MSTYSEPKSHPDKGLKTHTEEVYDYLIKFYNIFNFENKEKLTKFLALHDVGKFHKKFQKKLENKEEKFYHPLLSYFVLYSHLKYYFEDDLERDLISLMILRHHSVFYPFFSGDSCYLGNYNGYLKLYKKIEKDEIEYINKLLSNFNILEKEKVNDEKLKLTDLSRRFDNLKNKSFDEVLEIRKSLLPYGWFKIADIFSAKNQKFSLKKFVINENQIKSVVKNIDEEKLKIQKSFIYIKNNCFLRATTGFGKTISSLYWAKGFENQKTKIFYILPTTTTINHIYDTLTVFGKDCGLLHHFYDVKLFENDKDVSEEELFECENLLKPIMITTPDQLALTFFNQGKWYIKNSMFYNSAFIFDEIHTYDFQMLFTLKYMLKILKEYYNASFLLMSATFPNLLEDVFNFLGAEKKYFDDTYNRKRFTIDFKEKDTIFTAIEDIKNQVKNGKKVLVVVNTVKKARDVYTELKKKGLIYRQDIILLHSRFSIGDKMDKEKELKTKLNLNNGFCLVSTQIVEVSLDLDFDILYTEIAPIDALIQRFGRVNRYGNKGIVEVKIFSVDENNPYEEDVLKKSKEILQNNYKNYNECKNELEFIKWVNNLYDSLKVFEKDKRNCFESLYLNEYTGYGIFSLNLSEEECQEKINEITKYREGSLNVFCIPQRIYENEVQPKIAEMKNEKDKSKKSKIWSDIKKRIIPIPIWKRQSLTQQDGINIINAEYSKEDGIELYKINNIIDSNII